jgi:hypothetical protein
MKMSIRIIDYHLEYCMEAKFSKMRSTGRSLQKQRSRGKNNVLE